MPKYHPRQLARRKRGPPPRRRRAWCGRQVGSKQRDGIGFRRWCGARVGLVGCRASDEAAGGRGHLRRVCGRAMPKGPGCGAVMGAEMGAVLGAVLGGAVLGALLGG
jgi:hypothetical protein